MIAFAGGVVFVRPRRGRGPGAAAAGTRALARPPTLLVSQAGPLAGPGAMNFRVTGTTLSVRYVRVAVVARARRESQRRDSQSQPEPSSASSHGSLEA